MHACRAAAGHSLGEHTAYHAADPTSCPDAARLVRRRGELMYDTGVDAAGHDGGNTRQATTTSIDVICERATKEAGLVVPANYNTDEQIVVSGEIARSRAAMELAKEAGAKRAIRLPVSGAFHSPLMEPAVDGLTDAIATSAFTEPGFPVFSNVTADASTHCCRRQRPAPASSSPRRFAGRPRSRNIAGHFPDALFRGDGAGQRSDRSAGRASSRQPARFACGTRERRGETLSKWSRDADRSQWEECAGDGQHARHRPRDRRDARDIGARVAVVGRDKEKAREAAAADRERRSGLRLRRHRYGCRRQARRDVENAFGASTFS